MLHWALVFWSSRSLCFGRPYQFPKPSYNANLSA